MFLKTVKTILKVLAALLISLSLPVAGASAMHLSYGGEIKAGEPTNIAAHPDGRIFVSQDDGTVQAMNAEGQVTMTLGGKDKKWDDLIQEPAGMAFYDGKIYIADQDREHIAVFTDAGEFIEAYGAGGSGPKQFSNPRGLYIYRGVVYIADSGNGRIQVMGLNGVYLGQIGKTEDKLWKLQSPVDVAVDERGLVYAVDVSLKAVLVFDQSGAPVKKIGGFDKPISIAMHKDCFYVADAGTSKITMYGFDFKARLPFGAEGEGKGKFRQISGLAVTPEGRVMVSDERRKNIQFFTPGNDGKDGLEVASPLQVAPPVTSVLSEYTVPLGERVKLGKVVWDGRDTAYAIDLREESVLVIKEGKVVKTFKQKDWEPVSMALDPKGNLWVMDADNKHLLKLDKEGKTLLSEGCSGGREGCFSTPTDMVISQSGLIYVSDSGNDRVQVYNTDGIPLRVIKDSLDSPVSLTVDAAGNLYVLDSGKKDVSVFNAEGRLLRTFGGKTATGETFGRPVALAVTGYEVLVLDADTTSIKSFTLEGVPYREFGSEGKGKGDLYVPVSLAAMGDFGLLVAETENYRLQALRTLFTPARVAGLKASAGTHMSMLKWDKSTETFIDKYLVYRAMNEAGPYEKVAETAREYHVDGDLSPEVNYFYRVTSVARGGNEGAMSDASLSVPTKYQATAPRTVKAEPREWSVDLKWEPNVEEHIAYYVVYRRDLGAPKSKEAAQGAEPVGTKETPFKEVGRTREPLYFDGTLDSNTVYEYALTAVSSDDVESQRVIVKTLTLVETRPPIEIEIVEMQDIFSNSYKYYENFGIGKVRVTNNTKNHISKLKLSFRVKDYMDFASEVEVADLSGLDSKVVILKAVLNNKILEVTEDTPVQTELTAEYYYNKELKSFKKNHTVNIYEMHRMMWNNRHRMAVFVTTKDPVVIEFSREVVTQYSDTTDPLLYASALYDALGVMGLTYIQDPTNSYQVTSGMTDFVDFLQYPRETLKRKSGDCDDLVILFSSFLESLGINTKIVDIPGHMFMMFSVGKQEDLGTDTSNGWLVMYEDQVWVPVEMTIVGKPFMKAWEKGSAEYYEWAEKGKVGVMGLREAWETFKPATMPTSDWRPKKVAREEIEKKFNDEFKQLRTIRVKLRSKKFLNALLENPKDVNARVQLGIVFAEAGETKESLEQLYKAMELDPLNPMILNNIGNVHFMDSRFEEAVRFYERASELDPKDPMILVNLAKVYLRNNQKEKAKTVFNKACVIDPEMPKKFRSLAFTLRGPI